MKTDEEKNYLSLSQFFSKTLFLGIGVAKILMDARESAIFSMLLGTLFGAIILYFINKLNYYKMNNFKKIVMFILIFSLFIIGLNELTNLISSIYLIDSNHFFIMLPLILIILYMNSKNISIHLKIAHLLVYFFDAFFIISLLSLLPEIDTLNYLPLFNVNFNKILFTAFEFALFSVVPNILYGGIKPNFESDKLNFKIIKQYLLSNLIIIGMIITTQGVLSVDLINLFKFPEYVVLKKISLLDFINNIENILSFCIMFDIYIFLSICSKQLYDMSYETFNNKYIYPIFLIVSLFFISNFVFDNVKFFVNISKYLWIICLVILVIYILLNINTLKKENDSNKKISTL